MRRAFWLWLTLLLVVSMIAGCTGGGGGPTQFTLTMETQGQGTVSPEGAHQFAEDTVVNVTATPAEDWEFSHWVGEVAEVNQAETTVVMDKSKTVRAVFAESGVDPTQFTLTVEVQGQGTVTPAEGTHAYDEGTLVQLTATPAADWEFVRWDGEVDDTDSGQTNVVIDNNMTVTAVFEEIVGPESGDQTSYTAGVVDFNMRLAPAATFPTGANDDGEGTVDTPFWIAETQVTYELWHAVYTWATDWDRGRSRYEFANAGMEGSTTGGGSYPNYNNIGNLPTKKGNEPVTMVSWRDSIVWANALSEMLGYAPVYSYNGAVIRNSTDGTACDNSVQENTDGFRLPTSDEWELAARYIDGSSWTPGDYASGATADYNNASATQEVTWYS